MRNRKKNEASNEANITKAIISIFSLSESVWFLSIKKQKSGSLDTERFKGKFSQIYWICKFGQQNT